MGPTPDQELAVARWADEHAPDAGYKPYEPFDHPELGPVELGGCDEVRLWSNPPFAMIEPEVRGHADFAIAQALAAPALALPHLVADRLGDRTWRVTVGVANTGWLPTTVTARAAKEDLVLPIVAELTADDGEVVGPARHRLGQLAGRADIRRDGGARNDGTPDRAVATWVVRAPRGARVRVSAHHPRAGTARAELTLGRS
jgi:hypothetical protein